MATAQRPLTGQNDSTLESGALQPGFSSKTMAILKSRAPGGGPIDEPPAKAELRKQAADLKAKAAQLSAVERELEKERQTRTEELDAREADLAQREAILKQQLKDLEG